MTTDLPMRAACTAAITPPEGAAVDANLGIDGCGSAAASISCRGNNKPIRLTSMLGMFCSWLTGCDVL